MSERIENESEVPELKSDIADNPETETEPEWKTAGFISEKQAREIIKFIETPLEERIKGKNPEDANWVEFILSKARTEKPGEVAVYDMDDSRLSERRKQVVYCDKEGKPVTVAILVEHEDFATEEITWRVQAFATDKSRGILSARSVRGVFDKVFELDAARSSSTTSPDAIRFTYKYFTSLVAKLPPETYRVLGGKEEQPLKKADHSSKKKSE